jgi:hypothetical protein
MTPKQIKAAAKQAGGDYDTDESDPMSLVMFYPNELTEFVRLVRKLAFDEAANAVKEHRSIAALIRTWE